MNGATKNALGVVLMQLVGHYAECEDYWLGLAEHDADYIAKEKAMARMGGVEECIMIVRRFIDEN